MEILCIIFFCSLWIVPTAMIWGLFAATVPTMEVDEDYEQYFDADLGGES